MIRKSLSFLSPLGIAAMLFMDIALAEPEVSTDAMDDADFAKSFLGKPYSGTLSIEGWTDISGGLVSPPIYVQLYQREDGTSLVLTSKESEPPNYEVIDALLVTKPKRGAILSIACTKGEDYTLRFIGVARGSEDAERWTRIDSAWEIELPTGKILKTKTRGVKCENPSW